MPERVVYLRVDVDFHEGLRRGVPFLLDLFRANDVQCTFFVVMGPDTLHKHSRRVGEKAFRSRVRSFNAWRVLYELGPAWLRSRFFRQRVAGAFPALLKEVLAQGHEIGVHGYDHAMWADRCYEFSAEETAQQMERAFAEFRSLFGDDAATWGAPNWRSNDAMFRELDARGIRYSSDTRGCGPYYPLVAGRPSGVLQLPINLPCLHELVQHGVAPSDVVAALVRCLAADYNLLCIHDYYEGILARDLFARLVERLGAEGYKLRPLGEAWRRFAPAAPAAGAQERVLVPGGARAVSCQDRFLVQNYFDLLGAAAG